MYVIDVIQAINNCKQTRLSTISGISRIYFPLETPVFRHVFPYMWSQSGKNKGRYLPIQSLLDLNCRICISFMLTQKCQDQYFFIKQVKNFLPRDSMRMLYFSLVHSHYTYGILAWANASKTALHCSIVFQKWALHIINTANNNGHTLDSL